MLCYDLHNHWEDCIFDSCPGDSYWHFHKEAEQWKGCFSEEAGYSVIAVFKHINNKLNGRKTFDKNVFGIHSSGNEINIRSWTTQVKWQLKPKSWIHLYVVVHETLTNCSKNLVNLSLPLSKLCLINQWRL